MKFLDSLTYHKLKEQKVLHFANEDDISISVVIKLTINWGKNAIYASSDDLTQQKVLPSMTQDNPMIKILNL